MFKSFLVLLVWCRVEPIVPNGDDYLVESTDIRSACGQALERCEDQYKYCRILGCGTDGEDLFIEKCDLI